MGTAQVNGISIAYDDVGRGDAVLLVHGHPFDRSMWRPQVRTLSRAGWRVITPDLRGYGDTTVVPGTTALDLFADDLAGLLDNLALESVVVGGLSMGGQIVMELCRRHPQRVRALILAATSPQADTAEQRAWRVGMADRLTREGLGRYADEVLSQMLAPATIAARPEVAEHVLAMMRRTPPEGAAAALRGRAERVSYDDVLAELDLPALIVVGDLDRFTPRIEAERMQALMARASIICMEGVAHMPNLERPDEFNAALLAFLVRSVASVSAVVPT